MTTKPFLHAPRLLTALALGLCLGLPIRAAGDPGLQLFVCPSGDDNHTGLSSRRAFSTVTRARDEIRQLKAAGKLPPGPVTVNLLPGIFPVADSIAFTAEDSGTAAQPVTYRATKQGQTRLIGAARLKLKDFNPVTDPAILDRLDPSARGQVVTLSVAEHKLTSAAPFPQKFDDNGGIFEIFAEGKRMSVSRWPNGVDTTTMKSVLVNGNPKTPGVFEYRDDRVARWTKNPHIWLKGQWRVGWEEPALRVASINTTARTITFAVGVHNGIGNKYTRPLGNGKEPWFAINLLEEIDQPGEWALDFATQTVYLWPTVKKADAEILITQLATPLVTVTGASHLRFIGLTLESSLGDGFVLEQVSDTLVAGCTVRNLGRRGIVLNGMRSGLQSNDVYGVGHGALYVSGGDRKALVPSENFVVNNHLHNFGVVKSQYSPGVGVGLVDNPALQPALDAVGIRFANNAIHHSPRDAFLYSGNDNLYEFNEIYYCGFNTRDTGAFYSWLDWTMRGNVIRYNYIHSTIGGVNPDDGASGNFVFGNIFSGSRAGVWIASGPDNTIQNNIFIKEAGAVFGMDDRGTSRKYVTNKRLIQRVLEVKADQEPWLSRHPEVNGMLDRQPDVPWRTRFVQNLIVNPKPESNLIKLAPALKTNPEVYFEKDNYTTATDPGFVNAAKRNYTLRADSEVFKKIPGFQPIPFEKMGLHIDEYRRRLPSEDELQRGPAHDPYRGIDHNFGT